MFSHIQSALIKSFTDGDHNLDVAYPNISFTPKINTEYAQLFIIPNQPYAVTLGNNGEDEYTGIMQINLNYPVNTGTLKINLKREEILARYKAGMKYKYEDQSVLITSAGQSAVGQVVDNYYRIPLTIEWIARTFRNIEV